MDEINSLKVNLISLEELYHKAKFDINILQNDEFNHSKSLTEYENKIKNIKEEMAILQIQVDTYQKDFESERDSRQNMAGERDNLLIELKNLQICNQKLIEEAESNLSRTRKNLVASNQKANKEIATLKKPMVSNIFNIHD